MAGFAPQELLWIYLVGRAMSWRYRMDQYTSASLETMRADIDQARREILAKFAAQYSGMGEWTADRMEQALYSLDDMSLGVRQTLSMDVAEAAAHAGSKSADWHMDTITVEGAATAAVFNTVTLSPDQLRSFYAETPLGGSTLSGWVDKAFDSAVQERMRSELNTGSLLGEGYPGLVNRLTDGFDQLSRTDAVTLARTYIQSANVDAQERVFAANSDVVKGLRWTAILDTAICPRCAALDGNEYRNGQHDRPPMPLHPRCRCIWIPALVSWRDLGVNLPELEDAARPYTVREPGNVDEGGRRTILEVGHHEGDFGSWWETLPENRQADVLGPRRAEMVRGGKVAFKDLVDAKTGALRTLEELGE